MRWTSRPGATVALACLAIFVVILDATIVAVALADIRLQLGMPADQLAWVVNAYTLVFAGFLLFGGRCADVFGQRRTMLVGAALFTASSLAAGLAASAVTLLVARALQGLGAALLMPTTLAALTTAYDAGPARTRALAAWSTVGAVGGAAGTVIGGILTQWAGWRWVFLVNVPIGVAVLALAALVLGRPEPGGRPRLDIVGAVLVTVGLSAVVYAVMETSGRGPTDPVVLGALVGGIVVLVAFGCHQHFVAAEPLLPLSLFRVRTVASANAVMFLLGLGFFASPVLLSLYLQTVHGLRPFVAGLSFLPGAAGLTLGGRFAGRVTVAIGTRRAAIGGLMIAAVGFVAIGGLLVAGDPSVASVEVGVALFGLGIGLAMTPITVVATMGLPPRRQGLGAGLLNTIRQASGAIGLAVLSVVATGTPGSTGTIGGAGGGLGYGPAYLLAAVFALAAALLAVLVLPRDAVPVPPVPPAPAGASCSSHELRGQVRRPDGTVPPRAVLTLTDAGGRQVALAHAAADGTYLLDAGQGGDHLLICAAPSEDPSALRVVVPEGVLHQDVVLGRLAGTLDV